jgi:oligopeptide/dipeptide ABC transporter ATP-binding protein
MMLESLLQVKDLKKHFLTKRLFSRTGRVVHAVDGVSFTIEKGETFGLVGESGCGKSTIAKLVLRLLEPTAGQVYFEGYNLFELGYRELRQLRRRMQVVFQDPTTSLNPRMTAGEIIGEPLAIHNLVDKTERAKRVSELMELVGLSLSQAARYPHEFSAGQKQRIGIARALAVDPVFIVADEPVSSLDVSIRAQILNLMQDLQQNLGLTYLFISHDLSVVKHLSDRIAVMYLGRIVELGSTVSMFNHPRHPYTQALLSAIPIPNPEIKRKRIILEGEIPSPIDPPTGCKFHTRCPNRMEKCGRIEPELVDIGNKHFVSCHLVSDPKGALKKFLTGQTMTS